MAAPVKAGILAASAPSTPSAALPTLQQVAVAVDGQRTEVAVSVFADRILLLVTQLGRVSTWVEAESESSSVEGRGRDAYSVRILLGTRDAPMITLLARQLAAVASKRAGKPLLIGFGLPRKLEAEAARKVLRVAQTALEGAL